MGRTACTEPQCLYRGEIYLFTTTTNVIITSFRLALQASLKRGGTVLLRRVG